MIVQEPVQATIWHCLNHYAYSDAIFLAERLHAEVKSEETIFLLGTCYYRCGRVNEAYWLLNNAVPTTAHTRFLLAKCALDLHYLNEAEAALGTGADSICSDFGEQAPFALQLLAQVYVASERRSKAADAHRKALKLNPFLWNSFHQLCDMGEKVDAQNIFQSSNIENYSNCHGFGPTVTLINNTENIAVNSANIVNSLKVTPANVTPRMPPPISGTITPDSTLSIRRIHSVFSSMAQSPISPSFGVLPLEESPMMMYTPTLTDANEQKAIPKIVNSLRAHVGQLKEAVFSPVPRCALGPAPRRSSRLFSNNSSYSVKENNKSPNRKFTAPKSPSRKTKQRVAKNNLNKSNPPDNGMDKCRQESNVPGTPARSSGIEGLLSVLRDLGAAYKALSSLDCRKAIQLFEECTPHQFQSPWVQSMVAQAHYELAEYDVATTIYAQIRTQAPRRTEGMDIYGTCLWHLQRESDLSALAQDLVSIDKLSPVSWMVAGNCFSLHKERDTALRFFRRAIQLAPDNAYAHALLGHEYAVAEETDKALMSFRNAVRIDPRSYVALFGIATVYARQERWRAAETHFRKALAVHPGSAVLRCHLGVAQAALGRPDRALATLERAVALDPRNPLCRFQHASILLSSGRPREALKELNSLKDTAPRESLVYYLLGKVHNKLGHEHLALMHFSWATDLDPKGTSGHIKDGFDGGTPKSEEPPEPAS